MEITKELEALAKYQNIITAKRKELPCKNEM